MTTPIQPNAHYLQITCSSGKAVSVVGRCRLADAKGLLSSLTGHRRMLVVPVRDGGKPTYHPVLIIGDERGNTYRVMRLKNYGLAFTPTLSL
jgi:hypothetical protein